MTNARQDFPSEEAAFDWLFDVEMKNEDCVDNGRFAFEDDKAQMEAFEEASRNGCCGQAEYEITVNGRNAVIGCNYGH